MFDCKRWGFHRYDMVFLIRCLFLCSSLRSDRALRDALVSSLHVLFQGSPGGEANYFIEILGDNDFPVPSPSTLGHMRFVLDCVAMLQKRKYHEKVFATGQPEPALFFLLDSSPQGNVNWLMIEYFLVEGNKLQGLCADAWRLHKLGRVRWQDDPDEERVAEERRLVERLTSVVQHHVLPPVGLGSGRSSLQYEHHAFLHALFLETGNFELMCAIGSQTTAIASDKGDSFMADDGEGQNKGIADAMLSFWEEVYPSMNALISCLSAKFFRQRFAATCFRASEIACGQFESFVTAITDMELAEARAHPLTKRFCEEGPLNSELLDFLNGRDRSELALVMQEAGRLLLVPVNEISVERLHAQTRKQLKRGPAAGADYDKISKQIVYHLDLQSQFLPSNPAFSKRSSGGIGAREAVSLEDLREQLLLEKFRQVHAPGTFYTIHKGHVADVLVADELPAFRVNSRPQESATDLSFQADGDGDVDSAMPGPVQNQAEVALPARARDRFIAFQVLNIQPSAKKYALCDTGKELQVTDIAVSQHRILQLDTAARELEVSMEPVSDSKAWSRMLTARALSSCYAWSAKTGSLTASLQESLAAHVASEELLQQIRACVSMLYLARAVPNTTNYIPATTLQGHLNDGLDFLLSKNCVLVSNDLCQLTSQGLEALQLTQVLVEPTALLSLEADTPARKRSAAALLHFLVEKGWSLEHVKPRAVVAPLGPFSEASPPSSKTILLKENRKTIDREYMLALVLVEDASHRKKLLDIGINSIEHLMPLPFYVALNNADEAGLQAMLMEADAGDDEADLAERFRRVRQGWRRKAAYRLDTSFRWGCVSFKGTRRKLADGGWSLGYECDCPRRSHSKASASGGRTRCTWTMQYADEDERLLVLRKLKWWVTQAWSCNSKQAHQAFRNKLPDELPSMHELDEIMPAEGRPLTEDEADQDADPPPTKRARGSRGPGFAGVAEDVLCQKQQRLLLPQMCRHYRHRATKENQGEPRTTEERTEDNQGQRRATEGNRGQPSATEHNQAHPSTTEGVSTCDLSAECGAQIQLRMMKRRHDAAVRTGRPGPQSVYELLTWPTQVCTDAIRDEEARATLAANMSHGLLLASDYAGARMADDALHRVSAEIASILKLGQGDGQCRVRTAYTCDCEAAPMMVCLDGSHPADHHFQLLEERLPKNLLQEVNDIVAQSQSAGTDMAAAYQSVARLLMRRPDKMARVQSNCIRHFGSTCAASLFPEDYRMDGKAVSMNIAGVTCVGFSQLGGQAKARLAHASMKSFHIWAWSVRNLLPDVIVAESAQFFEKGLFTWWFEDRYYVVFLDHPGPSLLGFPMNRPRMYVILVNRDKFITTASFQGYKDMFSRNVCLSGDAYFNAKPEDVLKEARHLAGVRKVQKPTIDQLDDLDWLRLYPVGMKERYRQYDEARLRASEARAPEHSGVFIADLEQSASFGPVAGHFLPTLVTHGCLHSWRHRRCLIPLEHLGAQGVQIYPHATAQAAMQSLMQPLLQSGVLSRGDQKRLAGNGMHQPTVASVVLYTLSSLHRINKHPSPLQLHMQLLPDAADADDDAGATASVAMRRMGSVVSDGDGGDGLSL
ncbi:unnamed protein product [Symbiodinium sp. CCMP2592]|nr:unnamed protein product [Symbiodinium sp. CCMP2592]